MPEVQLDDGTTGFFAKGVNGQMTVTPERVRIARKGMLSNSVTA